MSALYFRDAIIAHNARQSLYPDPLPLIPVPVVEAPTIPPRPFVGSYEVARKHIADRPRLRMLIDGEEHE